MEKPDELSLADRMTNLSKLISESNVVKLSLFNGFEWVIMEYDSVTADAFGFVNLNDPKNAEFGYFNILEIERLSYEETIKDLNSNTTLLMEK